MTTPPAILRIIEVANQSFENKRYDEAARFAFAACEKPSRLNEQDKCYAESIWVIAAILAPQHEIHEFMKTLEIGYATDPHIQAAAQVIREERQRLARRATSPQP